MLPPLPPITPPGIAGDFQIPALDGATQAAEATQGSGEFGQLLGDALGRLGDLQIDAATQSQALATGRATDVSAVAMSVERASLALQLAAQIRNKAVEAYQDLFRMQV